MNSATKSQRRTPKPGLTHPQPVIALIKGEGEKDLVTLSITATDGRVGAVEATTGHPIWTEDGWVDAGNLAPGDSLRTSSGAWVQVAALQHEQRKQLVYNLTVDTSHTFFVYAGESSILTHNCSVNWGQQGKHLPGHPNYIEGRSTVTANPDDLIRLAGTGAPVGNIPRGQAGFKERIDYGHMIGHFVDKDGISTPSSIGILHYRADGSVHIVPGRPQ